MGEHFGMAMRWNILTISHRLLCVGRHRDGHAVLMSLCKSHFILQRHLWRHLFRHLYRAAHGCARISTICKHAALLLCAVPRHVHGNSDGHVHGYVYADTCIDVGSYVPGVSWFGKTMEQVATGKY